MKSSDEKCFVLSCDQEFKLIEILKEKNLKIHLQANEQLVKIIAGTDYAKFLDFMLAVKTEESIFNYKMCVQTQDDPSTAMSFGGIFMNGQYIVTAFSNYLDLYEELLSINNLQTNRLREIMKHIFSTPVNYEQFMKINNDLINAQRDAQKKNAIIEGLLNKTNQLNIELKELNATKDRLFSIISHDLRAPLANIIAGLNLISYDPDFYEKLLQDGFFENLRESTGLTMQMLENVLEWSKIQLGEQSHKPKTISLQALIKPVVILYGKIAKDKGIELIAKNYQGIEVYGDPQKLEVVIRNLISNAIKFTQPSGTVILNANAGKEYVSISIEDNGIGMTPKMLGELFSGTFDTTERGTNDEKGTGFGLLLCDKLIKEHHGNLTIESVEGKGTKFIVNIPVQRI